MKPDLSPYYDSIFYRTTDLHPSFAKKSIFVVGHTGFFGRWILGFLCHLRDEKGVNLTVNGGSLRSTGLDVLNLRTYPKELREADYAINCAGDAGGRDLDAHRYGPMCLCAAIRYDALLLQFSSGVVTMDESTFTDYAKAKNWSESVLWSTRDNLKIVRPFATVGPDMDWYSHFAVPTFLRGALSGKPLSVAPDVTRSFCHITDLVVQCLHVMVAGKRLVYEVGSDDVIPLETAARLISDNVQIKEGDYPSTSAAKHYSANLTHIRSEFNLELEYTSEQAILDTARFYGVGQGAKV